MNQIKFKEEFLIGPKRVSPLKSLMQFLDKKCEEYYPTVINSNNYKNSLPNFSKAVVIDRSKVYRANVPGYFYRSIPSASTSDISVLLCHSSEYYIDHAHLGYTTSKGWNYSDCIYDVYKTKKEIEGKQALTSVACRVQSRKADNGIPDIPRQYFCNTNSVGSQLVAVVPGAGDKFSSADCGVTSLNSSDDSDTGNGCMYKNKLVRLTRVKYASESSETIYALDSASGFYFQYWEDNSNATLLFVPAFCWSDSKPTNAITEIRTSDLTNEGGDFVPGDITWEVECGDATQKIFSDGNEGKFYDKKKWKDAPDDGNYSYNNHESHSVETKKDGTTIPVMCSCFIDMFNWCSLDGMKDPFWVAKLTSSIKQLHSTDTPWEDGATLPDIVKKEYNENLGGFTP